MDLRSLLRPLPSLALAPLVTAAVIASSASPLGCSATDGGSSFGGGDPGAASASAASVASGAGGATSSSTAASGGSGGGGIELDASVSDAPSIGDAEACASASVEAQLVPLDMVILLDRSGSMTSNKKWDGVTAALGTFINDPASQGIHVGILYFPIEDPPDGESCNYKHYEKLAVDIGELPANAEALLESIDAEDPEGSDTPMYGALKGALFASTKYQDANPTHKVILVFASDGDPNGCPGNEDDIPIIAGLAQSALNYNGVQTYVIAIEGADLANLNQIAAAGGTKAAYDVTGNVQQFAQKMAEIRQQALTCEFVIPPPPEDREFDPNKVNVAYVPGGVGEQQKIPFAEDADDCGSGHGWYYDNNAEPTKILLCPASCSLVQADQKAKVDVLFGCKTEIN